MHRHDCPAVLRELRAPPVHDYATAPHHQHCLDDPAKDLPSPRHTLLVESFCTANRRLALGPRNGSLFCASRGPWFVRTRLCSRSCVLAPTMSFAIEVPGEANPLNFKSLCCILAAATSHDHARRQAAGKQLNAWEHQPGYYSSLQVGEALSPTSLVRSSPCPAGCLPRQGPSDRRALPRSHSAQERHR